MASVGSAAVTVANSESTLMIANKKWGIAAGLVCIIVAVGLFPLTTTPKLSVNVVDYAYEKTGTSPRITLTVTNHSPYSVYRIDRIVIEQNSTTWCNRLRRADIVILNSGSGQRIDVERPEARGRWRVVVLSCPKWREQLDNNLTCRLHIRLLNGRYHAACSDWIDD